MILEILGFVIGSVLAAFIVFTLISFLISTITRYKVLMRKNLNITLTLSVIIALIWGEIWGLTPDQSIIRYVPAIIFVYLYDRRKFLTKKCPQCQERIKADAQICKHCQSAFVLNKEA